MYNVCMFYVCLMHIFVICVMHVCMMHVRMYIWTTCILDAHEGQKRVLDVLELELWMAVSHHVGSGNQTPVLCMSSQHSQLLSCLF